MKKKKGMTLLEIIVSLAIYAVFTMLIAQVMTLVNLTMRSTNALNRQLSYESKYADNMLTRDHEGSTFHGSAVQYRVRYGNSDDWDDAANRWASTGSPTYVSVNPFASAVGAYDPNDPNDVHNFKDGQEYVTHTPNSAVVNAEANSNANLAHNAHYRFMTFDRNVITPAEYPGDEFFVTVRLVPWFTADDATIPDSDKRTLYRTAENRGRTLEEIKATITGSIPLVSGDMTVTLFTGGNDLVGTDQMLTFENVCETIPSGTQEIQGSLSFNVTGTEAGGVHALNETTCTFTQFVQIGSSEANRTYYQQCVIEYNLNTKQFQILDSYTQDQSIPDLPDYSPYH